ncbi:homeobox-leucine zipper protein HAT22 [Ricinus communis]|uniref:Homeobox protein, putative n=1 Tax=Ricinus communis TaxID=3988 RepID=B9R6T5_RICCO|nr:homeobox-leucine zipper protein HAT22 [Ricinus communis]EEF52215.1 homeobox protein, putative [Ricinus communis]|eukprot:XP_002510028.1 homeobox-leucine zipper protein HAT22 [Ricinus communis]
MGFGISDHGTCNTGLGLGLICHEKEENSSQHQSDRHRQGKKKKLSLKYDHMFPSLTLGLPQEAYASVNKVEPDLQPQASSPSAVSSFSNSSVKKERDSGGGGGGEEVDGERVSSRVSDEDEEGSPRKKLRLTKQQSAILEDNFKEHSTLNPKQKQALAEQLNLRPRQVEVWFQNRRARTKLKQTEVDCEVLKKCCETLTEENNRLQKELQELKSLKLQAAPFYMQLPAATLTMCPSCERIGGGGDGSSSTSTITVGVGSKPHFYSPFTHPSAAC